MNRITRIKNANYTTISNVFLRDKELSLKAKGFLAVVMSLPEDWDFSINGICSILPEGKTAIYSTIAELKEKKYCDYSVQRDERGVIVGNDYTFYEEPQQEKQNIESPYLENPNMDNNTQLNIDYGEIDINKSNKEERNNPSLSVPFEEIKRIWNDKCSSIVKVTMLTSKRKEKIKLRYKEFAKNGEPLQVYTTIVDRISTSFWINNESRENWRRGLFDWIFLNEDNWLRIWEGRLANDTQTIEHSTKKFDQYGNPIKETTWQ